MAFQRVNIGGGPSKSNVTFKIEVADSVTSDWYIMPAGIREINVDVITSGSAVVQTSNDMDGMVAGTAAGIDWDFGAVTANKAAVCSGVRGIRLVSNSGAATLFVNGILA